MKTAHRWTIDPLQRLLDASPDLENGRSRYNPAQYGITDRVNLIYEQEMQWPREYAGKLEFGGTFFHADADAMRECILEWMAACDLYDEPSPIVCIDVESTPYLWEALRDRHPLAAAAALEACEGDEARAEREWEYECLRWHRLAVRAVKTANPNARVGFYNAPWEHRRKTKPGVFAGFYRVCTAFFPSLYNWDEDGGTVRVRHARQIAGPNRPVIPLIFPDDINLAERYFAHGASAVALWSTREPKYYEWHATSQHAERLTRWPTEEAIPA